MVMEAVQEDTGSESTMLCSDHPYRNSTPGGGICAFCLQEKLGKLVSSSFPTTTPVFPSSSSSSPSDFSGASRPTSTPPPSSAAAGSHQYYFRRARIPFITHNKKKKDAAPVEQGAVVFKRSKSTATPRRRRSNFDDGAYSPRRRGFGFWWFLYPSNSKQTSDRKIEKQCTDICHEPPSAAVRESKRREELVVVEEADDSPARVGRRVSRSRSVGCGSRSFSGDFFERISTGFGDCTLRRVESHREGSKPKAATAVRPAGAGAQNAGGIIKEKAKCGGIFGGFIITSSSSSSSSSFWISSSTEHNNTHQKVAAAATPPTAAAVHGRSRSWGWAFASPIRALSKPTIKRQVSSNKTAATTPQLNAIPSLLAVRG